MSLKMREGYLTYMLPMRYHSPRSSVYFGSGMMKVPVGVLLLRPDEQMNMATMPLDVRS